MHRARAMRRAAACAALVAAVSMLAAPARAQPNRAGAQGDPLASADCRRALAALDAQEAAIAARGRAASAAGIDAANAPRSGPGADASSTAVRRDAAIACLATHADPAAPARLVRPSPVTVAPLAIAPASAPPSAGLRGVPPAPAARPVDRPYAITSCDPGGCWANDGSRLNRVGTTLWGPRGACTVQGTLLQCP